jgi:hypothetical protein
VRAQAELAIETLRWEWAKLQPHLVVLTNMNWHEKLVYDAIRVEQGPEDGFKRVDQGGGQFWIKHATDGMPAFLWMGHPERKKLSYVQAAAQIAASLV